MNAAYIFKCREVTIDVSNRRFLRNDIRVALEPKVFDVIAQLVARPNELVTRNALLDTVWGHRHVTASTLNRTLMLARRAFNENDTNICIQTVHRSGYRYVGPVQKLTRAAGAQVSFSPPLSARARIPSSTIFGRERELAEITRLFDAYRAVTIVGAGGMGKTHCALEFAHRSAESYPDGVWFSDLSAMPSGAAWLESLGLSLSIAVDDKQRLLTQVAEALAGRRALLLLDNCDRISSEIGGLIVQLLACTSQLSVLATSQQPLSFLGERVFLLGCLALPDRDSEISSRMLSAIEATPSIALLLARIHETGVACELTITNAKPLIELCYALDGMPLALELVATRFAMLSVDQVLARLKRRFGFLVGEVSGREHRHQTLFDLINWSFTLLSPAEQRLLCWLSIFVQGWSIETAVELSRWMSMDEDEFIALIAGLVNKSLCVAEPYSGSLRYRLLESVREFASDKLASLGEDARARDGQMRCIQRMTAQSHDGYLAGRMLEREAVITLEYANIMAAVAWATCCGQKDVALEIAGALLLYQRANAARGRAWTEAALQGTDNIRSRARGRALLAMGIIELHQTSEGSAADNYLAAAQELAIEQCDRWTLGCASGFRALGLARAGNMDQLDEHIRVTVDVAKELQDRWLMSIGALARGWANLSRDDLWAAVEVLGPARNLSYDQHQNAFIDSYLALTYFRLEQARRAAGLWSSVMHGCLEVSNARGLASGMEGCAYIAADQGEACLALRLLTVAEGIRTRTRMPLFRFWRVPHDEALSVIKDSLSPERFAASVCTARATRPEDAINEAVSWVTRFSQNCHDVIAPM